MQYSINVCFYSCLALWIGIIFFGTILLSLELPLLLHISVAPCDFLFFNDFMVISWQIIISRLTADVLLHWSVFSSSVNYLIYLLTVSYVIIFRYLLFLMVSNESLYCDISMLCIVEVAFRSFCKLFRKFISFLFFWPVLLFHFVFRYKEPWTVESSMLYI